MSAVVHLRFYQVCDRDSLSFAITTSYLAGALSPEKDVSVWRQPGKTRCLTGHPWTGSCNSSSKMEKLAECWQSGEQRSIDRRGTSQQEWKAWLSSAKLLGMYI
ncbi:UNVERIFIED_CONTAM: hypothetical protein K2H54_023156 [Gekko kuhli]